MSQTKTQSSNDPLFEKRPWGEFEVLKNETRYKCKSLKVNPGHQISYQSHEKRTEVWTVVGGSGIIILDDKELKADYGMTFRIEIGQKHRLRNTGKDVLEIIEVQLGSYFGEDDIKRYDDDYKR